MDTLIDDFPYEDTRRPPLEGQELRHVPRIGDYGATESESVVDIDDADVITSIVKAAGHLVHKVVLDIDHPSILLGSTTPGHHHLYINHEMTWDQYVVVLDALAFAGIIEPGYASVCKERGFSAVRLPWVKKTADQELHYKMRCIGCWKHPSSISEYRAMGEEEGVTPARFVQLNEGTLNRANGHFWCTSCYIKAGQPLGVAP